MKTSGCDCGKSDSDHIQPACFYRIVMKFKLLSRSEGFPGYESAVKRSGTVSVKVILNNSDFFGIRIVYFSQSIHKNSIIPFGSSLSDPDGSSAGQRLGGCHQGAPPVIILFRRLSGNGRQRADRVACKPAWTPVGTYDRQQRIIWLSVQMQYKYQTISFFALCSEFNPKFGAYISQNIFYRIYKSFI